VPGAAEAGRSTCNRRVGLRRPISTTPASAARGRAADIAMLAGRGRAHAGGLEAVPVTGVVLTDDSERIGAVWAAKTGATPVNSVCMATA